MADETEEHDEHGKKKLSFDIDWGSLKDQIVGLIATAIRLICLLIALVLVLRIVFTIAGANSHNGIVKMIDDWSKSLVVGFSGMFDPDDHKLKVLLNYGAAAVFWVIVGIVGSSVVKKVGSMLG